MKAYLKAEIAELALDLIKSRFTFCCNAIIYAQEELCATRDEVDLRSEFEAFCKSQVDKHWWSAGHGFTDPYWWGCSCGLDDEDYQPARVAALEAWIANLKEEACAS